jgi:hypothetical protein
VDGPKRDRESALSVFSLCRCLPWRKARED